MLPYVLAVVGAAVAAAVVNLGKALVQQCSLQYGTNGTAVQQVQTCGSTFRPGLCFGVQLSNALRR